MTDRRSSRTSERPPEAGGRDAGFQDEQDAAQRIVAGLAILGTALRAKAWESAGGHDLNPTQAQILALLLRADREGVTLAYLADRLGVSGPTASDSVSALEKKGLVSKHPSPADRRALAIQLTRVGRAAARKVAESPADILSAVHELSREDEASFLRVLVTLVRELEARGLVAPHRSCVTCRFFEPDADRRDPERPYYCAFARAHFGDPNLRLDCRDHEAADATLAADNWRAFHQRAP